MAPVRLSSADVAAVEHALQARGCELGTPLASEGGMSHLWLIRHRALDEQRVLKVMSPEMLAHREGLLYFEREQRTASQLGQRHPNIVRPLDFGIIANRLGYAVLPYFERGSLARLGGPPRRAGGQRALCRILGGVADALDFLATGSTPRVFVHRDVKPANVLVAELPDASQPTGILADFGLTRAVDDRATTGSGPFLSPAYAAPELWRGEEVLPATDVYAFAITVLECFAGGNPFGDLRGQAAWRAAHLGAEPAIRPPRDRRLQPLAELAHRSLRERPGQRPTAAAWRDALRTAAEAFDREERR